MSNIQKFCFDVIETESGPFGFADEPTPEFTRHPTLLRRKPCTCLPWRRLKVLEILVGLAEGVGRAPLVGWT